MSHPLRLFDSVTRTVEEFQPLWPGTARVYSCGPTVYSFQHIGNMRAYVFTDTLARTLRFDGLDVTHIINITDVGHLTSDADLVRTSSRKLPLVRGDRPTKSRGSIRKRFGTTSSD